MATVTGLTAARMLEIEGMSVVDGEIDGSGHLILTKHDGTTVDAGSVVGPTGPTGPVGPSAVVAIPGEIKLWPGNVLPDSSEYGLWDWCDGGVLAVVDYPIAAGHIAVAWKTFSGASDPGAGNFRKPDLRGLVPAGMDAMPGGSRANRMTRAVAIVLAAKTGEETHVITVPEIASHGHTVNDPPHGHGINDPGHWHPFPQADPAIQFASQGGQGPWMEGNGNDPSANAQRSAHTKVTGVTVAAAATGITVQNAGGNNGHETVQPTVMVPYIVKLDD